MSNDPADPHRSAGFFWGESRPAQVAVLYKKPFSSQSQMTQRQQTVVGVFHIQRVVRPVSVESALGAP